MTGATLPVLTATFPEQERFGAAAGTSTRTTARVGIIEIDLAMKPTVPVMFLICLPVSKVSSDPVWTPWDYIHGAGQRPEQIYIPPLVPGGRSLAFSLTKIMGYRILLGLGSIMLTCSIGCAREHAPGPEYPKKVQTGIDYGRVLHRARAGDEHSLSILFRVTDKVDGLGSELHCGYLQDLLRLYGDARFAAVLGKETKPVRESVIDSLDFAFAVFSKRLNWSVEFQSTYKLGSHRTRRLYP
jgi:hypothetical protein